MSAGPRGRRIYDGGGAAARASSVDSRRLSGSVDPFLEAGASNDGVAIPMAGMRPRLAVFIPERGDTSVELTELGGEDDVVSVGQTVQESGAVLAGALDLRTDVGNCSHLT
jgi:hypothetical protein